MNIDLLPCPFCGQKTEQPKCFISGENDDAAVYCTHCNSSGPWVPTDEIGEDDSVRQSWHDDAAAKWNTRK